jgi:GTPase SAR1 family protein
LNGKGAIHTYKFILIGNAGVGKTVAARGFAEGKPNATTQYKATVRQGEILLPTCHILLF